MLHDCVCINWYIFTHKLFCGYGGKVPTYPYIFKQQAIPAYKRIHITACNIILSIIYSCIIDIFIWISNGVWLYLHDYAFIPIKTILYCKNNIVSLYTKKKEKQKILRLQITWDNKVWSNLSYEKCCFLEGNTR